MSQKKSFWRSKKDSCIVSVQASKQNGMEDKEYLQKQTALQEIQNTSKTIIEKMLNYADSIQKYVQTMNKTMESFSLFQNHNNTNYLELSSDLSNQTLKIQKEGFVMSYGLLPQTSINLIKKLNEEAKILIELGEERHKAHILMLRSDETYEKMKQKGVNSEKLTKKAEKNRIRHETYEELNQAYHEKTDILLNQRQDIFGKAFAAFQFYLLQFISENELYQYQQIQSKFSFSELSNDFFPSFKKNNIEQKN